MTMAHHKFEQTLTSGEHPVPEPTTPTTEEYIIRGYDSVPPQSTEAKNGHSEVSHVLDALFDEYVEALRNPNLEFSYESGIFDTHETDENPFGEPIPLMTTIYRDEILKLKREDLTLYTKGSMNSGRLSFDAAALPKEGPITYDTICEAYVEDSINRAIDRANHPAHIRTGEGDDTEAGSKFVEVLKEGIKELGSAALNAVKTTASIFSGPIATHSPEDDKRVYEAAPGHPADPEDLTGDILTVTLKTVKPL